MPSLLQSFSEFADRYETVWGSDTVEVTISVDKPIHGNAIESRLQHLHDELPVVLRISLEFFNGNKERYGVAYIDDLSDPQIILSSNGFSVMWWSDKGESKGECVIGVDFVDGVPLQLFIGD